MSFLTQKQDREILWYFFKSYKTEISGVLVLMFFSSLFESFNLAALYPIMNYGLNLGTESQSLKFIEKVLRLFSQENLFVASCLLLIVLSVLAAVSKFFYSLYSNKLITRIVSDHQKAIFNKYLNADYRSFVDSQQGKIIYAGTIAPVGVSNNIFYITRLMQSIMTVLFFTIMLIVLAWQATAFILLISGVYALFVRKLIKGFVNRYSHLSVDEDRKKNVILNEFVTGIKTIKAFLTLPYWKGKYDEATNKSALYNFKVMMGRALPDISLKFVFFVAFAILGIFLNVKLSGNILPLVPLLGTFVMVAMRLIPSINLVGNDLLGVARFMPDTRIVYETLQEPMTQIKSGAKVLSDFKQVVVFENVWFKHKGADDYVLKGMDFSIAKRKMTAIVGPSGAGKSTLVHLLLRLYQPEKGCIAIDGNNIWDFTDDSYLRKIGYVSQETFIFNGTIEENIRFGMKNFSHDDVVEAAKLANAHDFIMEAENGYETTVGDAGVKLSGGQRQRLAIARAILRKPEILILDEATSSLDNISERAIQEAINKISQQTTILVIAHRLSTVQKADKIIVVEGGRIVESGTHEDLLGKEKAYFSLYKNSRE